MKNRMLKQLFLLLPLLGLAGCLFDDDDDASSPAATLPPGLTPVYGAYTLQGTVSFESVPYDYSGDGLNYDGIEVRPIRGVKVSVRDFTTDEKLDEMTVGDDGAYQFEWDGTNLVKLWVHAETTNPPIRVEDNTSNDALYVVESDWIDARAAFSYNYVARTGWNGSEYSGARAAAPFSILDAAYSVARRFLDETTSPPNLPMCKLNWSVNNVPESGEKSDGYIGTSHWDGVELYILGQEDVDTDEFDTHVIVHEWGHYFESFISRSDSIGGPHSSGDLLDPRVALGEGWGNALSAIGLYPNTVYSDSMYRGQGDGFTFDLQDNCKAAYCNPGWYSEETIQAIIFDLYDEAGDESYDDVELGIDGLYQVMTGGQKSTPALTTLFSFVAALEDLYPAMVDEIEALVTYHTASADFGISAIQDEWATGETHDAAITGILPLYLEREIGDTFICQFQGNTDYNKLQQNRFAVFPGDGGSVTVSTRASEDVDIQVMSEGVQVGIAQTYSGNESVTFSTNNGALYVVNIQGWGKSSSYSADVTISK